MRQFRQHLTEFSAGKGKNTHMTHIEDLVLDGGVKGAREAILALRAFRNMLQGHQDSKIAISVKWDGAPAVFAGIDPSDGEFFVAKKSIFNDNPKVYKSTADIDDDTKGDLNKKLKLAYTHLKDVGITGVIQGDFMFAKADLKKQVLDGVKSITFHPNTIVYSVPIKTDLAKTILASKLGIVWHTTYSGTALADMTPTYGATITPTLTKSKDVWMVDATLPDLSGTATLTDKETTAVTKALSLAGKTFNKIKSPTLTHIETNKELNLIINTFNNTKVRAAQRINPKTHVRDLIEWVHLRYDKEASKRSSEKGKKAIEAKRREIMVFFSPGNKKNLQKIFELQNHIVDAKLIIINKLNQLSNINTFLKTKSGYKATNPEGFVAIDHAEGGAVKLVDRLEFSTNNFDPNIIKGWDNPG
jgi:hypothetical protein